MSPAILKHYISPQPITTLSVHCATRQILDIFFVIDNNINLENNFFTFLV